MLLFVHNMKYLCKIMLKTIVIVKQLSRKKLGAILQKKLHKRSDYEYQIVIHAKTNITLVPFIFFMRTLVKVTN